MHGCSEYEIGEHSSNSSYVHCLSLTPKVGKVLIRLFSSSSMLNSRTD